MRQRANSTRLNCAAGANGGIAGSAQPGQGGAPSAVIVTTPEALAALVREAVAEAMNETHQNAGPLLLDRTSAARALGIGTSSVDRFRKAGMPCVWVGDTPRFIVDECLGWLRGHRRGLPGEE